MVTNDDEIMVVRLQSMVPPRCAPRASRAESAIFRPEPVVLHQAAGDSIHHLCNARIAEATKGSGNITETYLLAL